MLDKIRDDVKCDYDVALAWAIGAKNALNNQNGFSPVQLVFGKASNQPSTINDLWCPPGFYSGTTSFSNLHK